MFRKTGKFLILGVLLILFAILLKPKSIENEIINQEEKVKKEDVYIVKSEDNSVFLFKNGDAVKEYNIDIRLLPGKDIKRLTDGITVESESAADRLAEDYDG